MSQTRALRALTWLRPLGQNNLDHEGPLLFIAFLGSLDQVNLDHEGPLLTYIGSLQGVIT